jgi:acetyl esterase/lipase
VAWVDFEGVNIVKLETMVLNEERNVILTCYLLDASKEMPNATVRPAMLVLPGGAYYYTSDREAEPIAMAYLAEGYQAFVLRYSVGAKAAWPNPLQDAEQALAYIRQHHERLGVDPGKIAAIGFSGGGHLAAALGTVGSQKPNALVLCYPLILDDLPLLLPTPVPNLAQAVTPATPPTFVFSTVADQLVPIEHSLRLMDALNKAKVPFESHIFMDGEHGLSLAKSHTSMGNEQYLNPPAATWFELSLNWLKKVLGDFPDNLPLGPLTVCDDETDGYTVLNSIGRLWGNPAARDLLLASFPMFQDETSRQMFWGVAVGFAVHLLGGCDPGVIGELDAKLKTI